jgi:hypothetical protein
MMQTRRENSSTRGKNDVLAHHIFHKSLLEWPVIETGAPQRKDDE